MVLCGAELCDDWRRHGTAEIMLAKLVLLRAHYGGMRRVRGDGNCFYRALMIGWLERLVAAPPPQQRHVWQTLLPSLTEQAAVALPEAVRAEFGKLGETFAARVKHVCEQASSNLLTDTLLLSELKGPAAIAKVRWLRLLASSHMRAHRADYEAVAIGLGKSSFEAFLKEEVEAMGIEADEPQVQALTTALNLVVRIEYLDAASAKWSGRCGPHRHVVCGPSATATGAAGVATAADDDEPSPASAGGAANAGASVKSASSAASSSNAKAAEGPSAPYLAACLLFRPGHYDVLLPYAAALAALASTTPPAAISATDTPDATTSAAANPAFAPPLPPAPPEAKDKACPVCSSGRSSCLLCAAAVCPYRNCSEFGWGSGSAATSSPAIAAAAACDAESMGIEATIDVTVPAFFGCSANRAVVCNPCLYKLPVAGAAADAAAGGGDEARFQLYRSGSLSYRIVGFAADMAQYATEACKAVAATGPVATGATAANGSGGGSSCEPESSSDAVAAPSGAAAVLSEANAAVEGDALGSSEAQAHPPEMQQLLDMGFDHELAAATLQQAGGDVQAAIQLLF